MSNLKIIYQAPMLDLAELNIDKHQDKWGKNILYRWIKGIWMTVSGSEQGA